MIATLSLMILLAILCVGILSLASVSLRSSQANAPLAEARANARVALILAIGQLQKTAGPDARVTAPADAAGTGGSGHLTGAWRSWEGKDHDVSTGLPLTPDYASKKETGSPDDPAAPGRFLGWLVSGELARNPAGSPPVVEKTAATKPLLSTGSLGADSGREVHLEPVSAGADGGIAWWIQGQNTKAMVTPAPSEATDPEGHGRRLASNGRPDPGHFGLEQVTNPAPSLRSIDLIPATDPASEGISELHFHDLTHFANGLLTNTANGGWRRDLSVFSEFAHPSVGLIAGTGIPVFTKSPGIEHQASLRLNGGNANASIYPWAGTARVSMSWNALADYCTLYKMLKRSSGSEPYYDSRDPTAPGANERFGDEIMITPVLARKHWIFSYFAQEYGNPGRATYNPRLIYKNVMTFWNPYNVAINTAGTSPYYQGRQDWSFPRFTFDIGVGGESREISLQNMFVMQNNSRVWAEFDKSDDRIWKPGESRVYSNSNSYNRITTTQQVIPVQPGYEPDGGSYRPWLDYPTRRRGDIEMSSAIRTTPGGDRFEFQIDTSFTGGSSNLRTQRFSMPMDTFAEKIPVPTLNNRKYLHDVAGEGNEFPFCTIVFGLRDLLEANIRTKGYVNTKPVMSFSSAHGDDSLEDSSYDLRVYDTTNFNAPEIPSSDDDLCFGNDHSGFVGTSFGAQAGIPRWIITELPTRPPLSLCELQHFDIAFNNPLPPRVSNPMGNSSATPKMRPDVAKRPGAEAYDHSYAANHLFFDDWFLSSIAPDGKGRSMRQVYRDHLTGAEPLPNFPYRPAVTLGESAAEDAADEFVADADSWKKSAAGLEVEGMFNVNSTSVAAWAALLKNQRNARIPTARIDASRASSWKTVAEPGKSFPVARTTVVSDTEAVPPQTALLVEPNDLSEPQIDALAEEIVKQVKKRGPFLSLSEFMNRQLSGNDDLALAGAVESALSELSKSQDASRNPFLDLQQAFPEQASRFSDQARIHAYPAAAEGYAVYGTPGWPRQADVLRPVAPVLSARDDTFLIRAYGSSLDPDTGKIRTEAWCEAVVQRKAEFVDPSSDAKTANPPAAPANKTFGRRFEIVSFRWLSPEEV